MATELVTVIPVIESRQTGRAGAKAIRAGAPGALATVEALRADCSHNLGEWDYGARALDPTKIPPRSFTQRLGL